MKFEMFEIGTNNKKYISSYDMEEENYYNLQINVSLIISSRKIKTP